MVASQTDVKCALAIFSRNLDASEITSRVGVAPSVWKAMGDPIRPGGPSVASHQWIWYPAHREGLSVDEQLDAIWDALGPHAATIATLVPDCEVVLDFEINHRGADLTLGWSLKPRHVAAAAAFGASIDIDEYDLTER